MGDADYIHAFQKVIMPIAMEYRICAYDTHAVGFGWWQAGGCFGGLCILVVYWSPVELA
jgi:hypothetical protein